MSITVKLDTNKAQRLEKFLASKIYSNEKNNSISKSPYWQEHSSLIKTQIKKNGVIDIDGRSGFYASNKTFDKYLRYLSNPSKILSKSKEIFKSKFKLPRYLSHEKAFDTVMNQRNILSPYKINHATLKQASNVYDNHKLVLKHYKSWSKRIANHNILSHYYYSNLLRGSISNKKLNTVLEIGAGNGNFPSILYNDWCPVRLIMIDLPETLTTSFTFLSSLFPNAKIILPNEIDEKIPNQFDFLLMTPEQIDIIDNESIDLAINIHSFQEMTHEQINIYYKLIQRVVRLSGYFLSSNRIEKIPSGPEAFAIEQSTPPNRFYDYPWSDKNKILIDEISSFHSLVQAEPIGIRLEQIH